MSDKPPVVHVGENSPEQVAYKLLGAVAFAEEKIIKDLTFGGQKADRKWLLDTYAECLEAVRGYRDR